MPRRRPTSGPGSPPATSEARPPWWGHPKAQQAVDFFQSLTLIGDYSGERWRLEPFQEDWIRELYGKRNPDGTRQTTTVSLWMPRGLGKTQQAAGIACYELIFGGPDREVYAAAPDRDKAARLFKAMAQMCRADPFLASLVDISDYHLRIKVPGTGSTFRALAADSDQGHSLAPSTLICDELHLWRHRSLYTALTSAFHKRKKGSRLEVQISTAGDSRQGLAWDLYSYAKSVRDGAIDDPRTLVRIFEATEAECEGDGWLDPGLWRRVMPCRYVDFDSLAEQAEKARHIPHLKHAFLQLYLGLWIEQSAETWIDPAEWRACLDADGYTAGDLAGEGCYAALDLSSNRDLTSLSLFFPDSRRVLSYSWVPSDGLADREEKDGVTYRVWADQGRLFTTPGARIVHADVGRKINELLAPYRLMKLVGDPHHLLLIDEHLEFEIEQYRQVAGYMDPPTKWLESAVAARSIRHDGDPLLAWAMGNVVVEKDKYENISPHKTKSRKRIDPAVALIMAIGAWLGGPAEPEVDVNERYSKANLGNYTF